MQLNKIIARQVIWNLTTTNCPATNSCKASVLLCVTRGAMEDQLKFGILFHLRALKNSQILTLFVFALAPGYYYFSLYFHCLIKLCFLLLDSQFISCPHFALSPGCPLSSIPSDHTVCWEPHLSFCSSHRGLELKATFTLQLPLAHCPHDKKQ